MHSKKSPQSDSTCTNENHKNLSSISPPPTAGSGFFSKPRTITALIVVLGFLTYNAMYRSDNLDSLVNIKKGIVSCCLIFLFIGALIFGNGPFIRPHPLFWRLVLGLSVLYQMFLTFLLFQNKSDARKLFWFIDSGLGIQLPERSYAETCALTWTTLWNQCDIFVVAHLFGWYVKGLLFRDYWILWILSVMFEVMEYSLQHQLPNFAECWWDHWLMDVAICNALGIYFGMKTCKYWRMKEYCWRGLASIPSYGGKVKRSLQQFTPHSWSMFNWAPGKSFKNYVVVLFLMATVLQCELNHFYLKYLLWIPPENWLNAFRLIMIVLICAPAINEFYRYAIESGVGAGLGVHAWLALAIIWTETLVCLKFSRGEFTSSAPAEVKIFWIVFVSLLCLYPLLRFYLFPRSRNQNDNKKMQ